MEERSSRRREEIENERKGDKEIAKKRRKVEMSEEGNRIKGNEREKEGRDSKVREEISKNDKK